MLLNAPCFRHYAYASYVIRRPAVIADYAMFRYYA